MSTDPTLAHERPRDVGVHGRLAHVSSRELGFMAATATKRREEKVRVHSGGSTAIGCNVAYRIGKFAGLVSGSWLDFGCADGGYVQELLRVGAERVAGVDVNPEYIAAAKARRLAGTSFEVVDGFNLPFDDASFDGALVNEVMEHVVDEDAVLRELHRVIRPDGVVVVISPNRWFPYECHGCHIGSWRYPRPAPFVPWLPRRISDHMVVARNYWPRELAALVQRGGFGIGRLGFVWPVLELEEYNWLPRQVSDWYRSRVDRFDSLPVIRRLGVSTMVVGLRNADGERRCHGARNLRSGRPGTTHSNRTDGIKVDRVTE
jgi:SAM-dependent methyltransferase